MREVFAEHRPTVVFHAAAYKHVGLMEANPVEAVRNNAIATRVVAHVAGRARGEALRAGLDRQGGRAGDRDGRVEGARRVRAGGRHGALPRHPLRGGALRQRARLLRQRRADLPPPDRARRPGDGHRRADDPLLHDDPRGGAADHPLRLARLRASAPRRRGVRARHGRAGAHPRSRARDDRAVRPRPRARHRDRDRRAPRRARSCTRSCSTATSARGRRAPRRSCSPSASRSAPEAVEAMFDEIGLLVLEGDAAGLAAKVSELSAVRAAARGERRAQGGATISLRVRLRPSYTPEIHDRSAARALAFELVHQDRGDRGVRRAGGDRDPVAAGLLRRRARSSACASGPGAPRSARPNSSSA